LQTEYSPWALETVEDGSPSILDTCKELGIALVAYSPLGRGFLTGTIKSPADVAGDFRAYLPRFLPENFDKNFVLVRTFEAMAVQKSVTPSQLVLAWLARQWPAGDGDGGIFPLFGTRSVDRARQNLSALDVTLSDDEDRAIRKACQDCMATGARYPDAFAYLTLTDTPELKG
jgi:aryl-alcohol dehydrogenase-like predicted oxidoreductase